MSIETNRHLPIFDPSQFRRTPIRIIGAGATGSRVFMTLIELGLTNIYVYDFDQVEAHNLANQAYNHDQIGEYKVHALYDLARNKSGELDMDPEDNFRVLRVEKGCEVEFDGVVFLLTDTMASRREIVENVIVPAGVTLRVFETRMASTHGNVLHFNPNSSIELEEWLSTLSDDEDAELSPCGSPISVGPTANIIANMAVWQFIHFMNDDGASDQRVDLFLKPFTFAMRAQVA